MAIHLTAEEKASRYDALQAAFKHTIESYQRLVADNNRRYEDAKASGVIGAYCKGLADAYSRMLQEA